VTIDVPTRLQVAGVESEAEVPAERYWLAWDGEVVLILWRHPTGRDPFGAAGGLAALRILEEALEGLEGRLLSQACGPNCDYPFAHNDVVLSPDPSLKGLAYRAGRRPWTVECAYSSGIQEPEDVLHACYDDLRWTAHSFGVLRAEGRALADVSTRAREALTSLLGLHYRRSHATAGPHMLNVWRKAARQGIRDRWNMRGWRKKSSRLIATLWLLLSTIEAKRYDWHTARFVYDDNKDEGGELVFAIEYGQEVNAVEGVDVSGLRAATEQASARLDNHAIAIATLCGAVAGGVVGGAASLAAALLT
jgi:hypothetical protein